MYTEYVPANPDNDYLRISKLDKAIGIMGGKVDDIKEDMKEVKTKLELNYATKEWCESKFGNTTKLVNAFLAILGTAAVGAFAYWLLQGGLRQ
jgi:hypothetical protein